MDIVKKDVDKLNAVVKIKIGPNDYQDKVDKMISDVRRQMVLPGFRPGKVPTGLVKKKHGIAILVDEINKLLSDSLYKYINENKIDILGNPLPTEENNSVDFEKDKEFEFAYDLGLAPDFDVKLEKFKVNHYKISVDDSMIDKSVEELTKRYGSIEQAESVGEGDVIYCEFVQLDGEGNELDGGLRKSSSLAVDMVKDEATKSSLIGLTPNQHLNVDPKKLSDNPSDLGAMLGVDSEIAKDMTSQFQLIVNQISRLKPSEVNQELFDKVYGEGAVKSNDEFRNKIKEELAKRLSADSNGRLFNDVVEVLMDKVKMKLPDEFLKRWLVSASKEPLSTAKMEEEYENYARGIKWQLIENKLIKDKGIKVSEDEAKSLAKDLIKAQFAQYGQTNLEEEQLESYAANLLANEEESRRLYDRLYGDRLLDVFKEQLKLKEKEISHEDFMKLADKK